MDLAFTHCKMEENNGIAIFTIDYQEKMNALNAAIWDDIYLFVNRLISAPELRVAIITGAGDKAFAAGADVSALKERKPIDFLEGKLNVALNAMEDCAKPVIAAINGFAFGGGLEVALACDIRIVSENAVIGMPETGLGFMPAAGGSQRLARMAGLSVAKDMILTGRNLNAKEALEFGIASRLVPQAKLMEEALKVARTIAARGPVATALAKRAVNCAFDVDLKHGVQFENIASAFLGGTEDMQEGVTAFLEKRKAIFYGK